METAPTSNNQLLSTPSQPSAGTLPPAVAPLQRSPNAWRLTRLRRVRFHPRSPELVDRKVRALLNKLAPPNFDSIARKIVAWANRAEAESDASTLIQVIRLVFERATDEPWAAMHARLCRVIMEEVSPAVHDVAIKDHEGRPIAGGKLFRKYLLNRCQEDFEKGWAAEAPHPPADSATGQETGTERGIWGRKERFYAIKRAERQGLGLIAFMGELFKQQMITERIMHESIKRLLVGKENPKKEDIASLHTLLKSVGDILDTPKARTHVDFYFERMALMAELPDVGSIIRFMLRDIIALRNRKWFDPPARNKQTSSKHSQSKPSNKAGDLSNFGKIGRAASVTFGPSSVFSTKKDDTRGPNSRTGSSLDMAGDSAGVSPDRLAHRTSDPDRSQGGAPTFTQQRRQLVIQPRSAASAQDTDRVAGAEITEEGGEEETESAPAEMSEAEAQRKIDEDVKELFGVRDLRHADVYFSELPPAHHFRLVSKLVSSVIESKEADAELLADFFSDAVSKKLCSPASFEDGFIHFAKVLEGIAVDTPKAFDFMAQMIQAANLDETEYTRIASETGDSERLLALLEGF